MTGNQDFELASL